MTITFRDVVSSVFVTSSWTTTTTTTTTTTSASTYPNFKALKLKARRTSFPFTGINLDMPSPILPPELIEAIIDELDDEATLRACALVSRTFVYRSQSHLFRTIDLDRDRRGPREKYHDCFYRLLCAKPHLGMYVRVLRLGDDSDDDFSGRRGGAYNSYREGGGRNGTNGGWILHSKTLPQTLQMLPRLQGFSLSFNSEMINWKSIRPQTRAAIGRLFRLPTLQAVSLEFISDFPVQLLLSLVRLRYLGLSCVEVGSDTSSLSGNSPSIQDQLQQVGSQGRWEARLESLCLRGTTPLTNQTVSHALALSTPATLRKLSVTPTFEEGFCDTISELINSTGSNITDFEWLPSIHFYSSVGSINISALSQLRVLRFVVSFRKTHAHGPFPEVLRLLGQISDIGAEGNVVERDANASVNTSNQLETIILDCHCIRPPSTTAAAAGTSMSVTRTDEIKALQSEWRPLDKALSRPAAFGALKEVKIRLSTSTSVPTSRARFTQAFQHLLPGLQKRGIIISVKTRADGDERFGLDDGIPQ